jgi:hypothetical protein
MPLQALLLNPWVLGGVGSLLGGTLPNMISSILGSKTEDEARSALAPQREAAIARLMGMGMPRLQATQHVDDSLKGEIEKKMNEGALPGWAVAGLGLLGTIGGGMAGAKLAGKLAASRAASAAPAAASATPDAVPVTSPFASSADQAPATLGLPFRGGTYRGKDQSARVVEADEIVSPFPGRRSTLEPEPTDYMRNPAREVAPVSVRDSDLPMLPFTQRRTGYRNEPKNLGYEPEPMPMDVHEERLMELAQHARRTPKAPPRAGVMSDLALPFDEQRYLDELIKANPQYL